MKKPLPRCRVVPLPDHQVSLRIGTAEHARWHFGRHYPRPFFYPFIAASGASLTRMGHPGAPDHDHHRSIWFAHHDVQGHDFWSDTTTAQIRQQRWLAYEDGDERATMAIELQWQDGAGTALLDQELIAALSADGEGGCFLELHSRFTPIDQQITLGKTNFGVLGVRVAKSISTHFGGGQITSSEGGSGEAAIFGQFARWMDYSGPVQGNLGTATEGITYFDHPGNPHYPAHWHVRADGWMGASLCRLNDIVINRPNPLTIRYLLHAHSGTLNPAFAAALGEAFANSPGYSIKKSDQPHQQFLITRVT